MSKIQQIQTGLQQQSNSKQKKLNVYSQMSFNGGLPDDVAKNLAKDVTDFGGPQLGVMGKVFDVLKKNDGEVQNQLVNALFTSTLAPFVIANNPVAKTDQKTKSYSAWRQPLSAIIAVAFGLAATMPSNNFVEDILSKGHIESVDLRIKPNEAHLKRLYKKERAAAEKNNTLEQFIKDNTPKNHEGEFNENAFVKSRQEKAESLFNRLLTEDTKSLLEDKKLDAEFKNLKSYVDKNNFNNVNVKDIFYEKFKVPLNDDKTLKVHAFESELHNIKAMDFLREFGFVNSEFDSKSGAYSKGSFTEENLNEFLASTRQKKVENILSKKLKVSADDAREIADELGKQMARQIQFNKSHKHETISLHQFLEVLNIKKEFIDAVNSKKMNGFLQEFKNIHLKEMEIGVKDGKPILLGESDFSVITKQITKNLIKRTESFAGNIKKYSGLLVALATLPFSCGLLNWVYPRFMEKFKPELLANSNTKGGN